MTKQELAGAIIVVALWCMFVTFVLTDQRVLGATALAAFLILSIYILWS